MTDLTRPDANRLRKILSGIMNFAKFRCVVIVIFSQDRAYLYDEAIRGLHVA